MGMTITEKILAAHCGKKSVQPGELIQSKEDIALANDSPEEIPLLKAINYLQNKNYLNKLKRVLEISTLCGVAGSGITYAGKKIFKRSRLGINSLRLSRGLIRCAGISGIFSVILDLATPDVVAAGKNVSEYYLTPEGFKEFLKLDKDSMLYHARRDEELKKGIISIVEQAKKLI